MTTRPRSLDHAPWVPGMLVPKALSQFPQGLNQKMLMFFISRAVDAGCSATPLENLEATISITDDAIHHMMRE